MIYVLNKIAFIIVHLTLTPGSVRQDHTITAIKMN